jgi:hypothetical protein
MIIIVGGANEAFYTLIKNQKATTATIIQEALIIYIIILL